MRGTRWGPRETQKVTNLENRRGIFMVVSCVLRRNSLVLRPITQLDGSRVTRWRILGESGGQSMGSLARAIGY